jgi:hypothetical protein
MPNIWVCKTGDGIGADYKKLIKSGIGGFVFTGGTFNPLDYRSLEDLDEAVEKVWSDYSPGHLTGKSFGRQLWAIARETRVGDWIYLECPSAAPKPKDPTLPKGSRGPQRTFVVAAGVVTGPYAFKPKHSCPHQLKVEWQWTGMELITYGFQHMVYVNIDSRQPQVMAALNAIWTPGKGSSLPTGAANKQKSVQDEPSIDEGWEEGQEVLKTHRKIERSAAATKAAKDAARTRGKGIIYCDSCGKAPFENYGVEIIEAHHVIPLSDTKGMARTSTPADFAMLCPTCHRAVHYVLSKGRTEGRDAIEEVRRTVLRRR